MDPQRKLAKIFSTDPLISELHQRIAPLAALQQLCQQQTPPSLRDRFWVGEPAGQQLRLFVDNGSSATELRQYTAQLLSMLQRKGYEFTGIRVGVQVRIATKKMSHTPKKQIDTTGRASLHRLLDKLDQASALYRAVERLLANSKP